MKAAPRIAAKSMWACAHAGMCARGAGHGARALLPVAVALACSQGAVAQGKGEVRLAVQPMQGLQYILDGKERLSNPGLMLEPGPHRFVFWAPDRSIVDTTIIVIADSVITFRKVLPVPAEYRAHVRTLKNNGYKRLAYRGVPILFTAASAVLAVSANKKRKDADEALRSAEDQYSTERNPAAIEILKTTEIPARQTDLDKAHRNTTLWTGATVLGAAATVFGFIKAARIVDPVYEDQQKMRFDAMAWSETNGFGLYATLQIPLR
jgi:hypothetical protein